MPSTVAASNADGKSRSLTAAFSVKNDVRSSTWLFFTYSRRPPPPQPQMIDGPWPAPMAVLILVLYASFWNSVYLIAASGLAALKRLTVASRMACCGWPLRNQ